VGAAILAFAAVNIAGCSTVPYQVRTGIVRTSTLQQMENYNMDRGAPILIRIYKEERTLEVWKQNRTGKFTLLQSYPICKFSGKLGPKIAQGDYQAPEGFYDITPAQMNPQSSETSPSTLVIRTPLTDLWGVLAVFLWCTADAGRSAVTL
jgi:murein L,D-transpeptidase YafK